MYYKIVPNPDGYIYSTVEKAIADNDGYCVSSPELRKCPCDEVKLRYMDGIIGECPCGLYKIIEVKGELK